jgi:hypothetical protein
MGIAIVTLVVLLCAGGVTIAQPLTLNANVVGGPFSNAIAELLRRPFCRPQSGRRG